MREKGFDPNTQKVRPLATRITSINNFIGNHIHELRTTVWRIA
jgi:hypothetical protein